MAALLRSVSFPRKALLLVAGSVVLASAVQLRAADDSQVRIDTGALQGVTANGVAAFKNIPYAAPPVGELRWRAPAAPAKWDGVRDATNYGNDCMQNRMSWDKGTTELPMSEDCLTLNVWTPSTGAAAKLPVMVWIHGGGFATGSGNAAMTAGDKLAARGVVVVTVNYRLGRFGFFAHPELTAEAGGAPTGNYAFMDQIAALQWVQRNIAKFGGDAGNVTIFGESAGGDSVNRLVLAPQAKGLFAKAISQSGGGRALWPKLKESPPELASAESFGVAFANDVGAKEGLKSLRALPAKKVMGDISLLEREKKTWSGPMLDGQIAGANTLDAYAAGAASRVPLLIGSNSFELGAIPSFFRGFINKEVVPRLGAHKAEVIKAYGSEDAFDENIASDFNFVEPARSIAIAASSAQPVYLYQFHYVYESKRKELKGAPHATDVAYVFDHLEASGESVSDADRAMAQLLGEYWISFARSGVPAAQNQAKWPAYGAQSDELYVLTPKGALAKAGVPQIVAISATQGSSVATAAPAAAPVVAATPAKSGDAACAGLKNFNIVNGKVTGTHDVAPPDTIQIDLEGLPPLPVAGVYCRVEITLNPLPGSEIRIEVWMPPADKWNGKFLGTGNAGYAGDFASPYLYMGGAITRGYATAGTDTGHRGKGMGKGEVAGAGWALNNPEKVKDYGHRAEHLTAQTAKAVIKEYYGRAHQYAYFQGCSNGGREALMEAQRYPEDYDGIVAGAPANWWTQSLAGFAWNTRALRDNPESALPLSTLSLVQETVIKQCDALDGVTDGMVEDPRKCKFDPKVLQCKTGEADKCLKPAQVEALKKIYGGPIDARSKKQIHPGFPAGFEAVQWEDWITGPNANQAFFSTEFFRYMVFGNAAWELSSLNFGSDLDKAKIPGKEINSDNPDLSAFNKRGGKLIMFHGWADAALTPLHSIKYYEAVRQKMGAPATDGMMRLYMVPGLAHCIGGPGPNNFDMLAQLEQWVEQKKPPAEVKAAKFASDFAGLLGLPMGEPIRTRPLCAYPKTAHYKGSGSIDAAENFTCK